MAPSDEGDADGYVRADEQAVLDALNELIVERQRPIWAREISTRLATTHTGPKRDGRWVTAALGKLAADGRVIQVRRWRTQTSRWTIPRVPSDVSTPESPAPTRK